MPSVYIHSLQFNWLNVFNLYKHFQDQNQLNINLNHLNSIYADKDTAFGLSLTMIFLLKQDF